MKRLIIYAVLIAIFIGIQFLVNCSNPLENTVPDNKDPIGPVYDVDTIYNTDTLLIIDTTNYIDTVFVYDSAGYVDTILVIDTVSYIDTVFVFDTTSYIDTVFVFDTTSYFDTIFVFDTLVLVDTVVIHEPDSNGVQTVCSRIGSNQHEIVWMFRNDEGLHLLEFTALVEKEHPGQIFSVFIDDEELEWKPVSSRELIAEVYLEANATVMILPKKPPAFGHSADICLTISPR